jgi:beta-N-acetylhexosaminidase
MTETKKTNPDTGKRFMLGAPPGRIGDEAFELLKQTGASVLLLFRSNFIEPEKLAYDLKKLRKKLNRPVVVTVDHETGQVLRDVVYTTVLPGNRALGIIATESETEAMQFARQSGFIMGSELASLGIGWDLAPVLDVLGEKYNPGILLRSFGSNPGIVAKLASEITKGLHDAGIMACAKHFPGLGEAVVDPHHNLPVIDIENSRLEKIHLFPFKVVMKENVDAIMTSHILFPNLDKKHSVTFSRKIAYELLRNELGYQGVLVSDDMEMGAVTNQSSIPQACIESAAAGHDMLIIGQKAVENSIEAINQMEIALKNGTLDYQEHLKALERIEKILIKGDIERVLENKNNFRDPKLSGKKMFIKIAGKIAEKSVKLLRDPLNLLPLKKEDNIRLFIPDVTPIAHWTLFESIWTEPQALAELLVPQNTFSYFKVPLNDSINYEKVYKNMLLLDKDRETIDILVLFNATDKNGQRQILEFLSDHSKNLIVIIVHNFHDIKLINENTTLIDTSGFRISQLEAAAKIINGRN